MADGFDIHVKAELAERLQVAAAAAGQSPADYALSVLDQALADDWAEADAAFAEYDRTGEGIAAEEALAELRKNVLARTARSI